MVAIVSLKGPCIKALVVAIGRGGTFKRWDLVGGLQVLGGLLLKGMVGLQLLPLLFFSFASRPLR